MTARVVILDRDGVINQDSDAYIKSVAEWYPLPGSIAAIARLAQAGYQVAIATNQAGIARSLFKLSDLLAIHQLLIEQVAALGGSLAQIAYCPHGPNDQCACRKPRPGLLHKIAAQLQIDLTGVPFVGDSLNDLLAAQAVGARPYLVLTGNGATTLKILQSQNNNLTDLLTQVTVVPDLNSFVENLLN